MSFNCLETNIKKGLGKKNALICIDKNFKIKSYTYDQLLNLVENLSFYLKKKLLKIPNPTVVLQSSAGLNTSIFMLACARIGVRFSIIFEDLPLTAVRTRILLLKPNLFFTVKNNLFISNLNNSLKKLNIKCKVLKLCTSSKNTKNLVNFKKIANIKKHKHNIKFFKSTKSLFVLFTSGSTGTPKGIEHGMGGYLLYSKYTTKKQFGLDSKSKFLCASDAGWINGHTYSIFGPLSLGSTTIILNSPMMILNEQLLKTVIKKFKITGIYLPVTIIKIMKAIYKKKKFLSKDIKVIGSMGEPLSDSVGKWFSKLFKIKPLSIVNTYFQTETGGIIYSPSYKDKASKKISVGKSLNDFLKFKNKSRNIKFELELQNPWPGCMKDCINGLNTWKKYWNKNNFKLFDIGSYNAEKNLIIHGRTDDVINVRGHRIGSEEIENVVIKDNEITEVAAVGCDDSLEGNRIILFASLNSQKYDDNKIKNINKLISNYFGQFAIPKQTYFISSLPKTRSGKILRRLLRDLYSQSNIDIKKDLSTMINPEVIGEIKKINESK